MKIALTSHNKIKQDALKHVLGDDIELVCFTGNNELPPQPFAEGGKKACSQRISNCLEDIKKNIIETGIDFDLIISIENSLLIMHNKKVYDVCNVCVFKGETTYMTTDGYLEVPSLYNNALLELEHKYKIDGPIPGFSKTLGEILVEMGKATDANNWMSEVLKYDRKDQIVNTLTVSFNTIDIRESIKKYENYPKEGDTYFDMNPLFNKPRLYRRLLEISQKSLSFSNNTKFNKIVGLKSSGQILASGMAAKFGVGYVSIIKNDNFPGEVYEKECNNDIFRIQKDSINKGDNILIIDDVLTNGDSLTTAIELIKKCGGNVSCCFVLSKTDSLFKDACKKISNAIGDDGDDGENDKCDMVVLF